MERGRALDRELAEAEAALLKAEETHGKDGLAVSYCLDNLVLLLRQRNRSLDAVNLDARARAIRIRHNNMSMNNVTPEMQEVNVAIKTAARSQEARKTRRSIVLVVVLLGLAGFLGKALFAPSPSERQMTQKLAKDVESILSPSYLQGIMSKGQDAVKDVQAAHATHNKQIDQYLGDQ